MQLRRVAPHAPSATVGGAFDIPLTLPFRNVQARHGLLVRGPAGWGEWSPFAGYGPDVTVRWWQAAVEAATQPWPRPRRDHVPVNAIVPAVAPEHARRIVRESGCTTAKVKVGTGDDRGRVGGGGGGGAPPGAPPPGGGEGGGGGGGGGGGCPDPGGGGGAPGPGGK